MGNLVASLDQSFLTQNAVHRPLIRLLRTCVQPEGEINTQEDEDDLVDVMAHVASRIKSFPELLIIFFRPVPLSHGSDANPAGRTMSPTPSSTSSTTSSKRNSTAEFLLFSFLLRFVHREGQIGNMARAGLLCLIEVAFIASSEQHSASSLTSHAKSPSMLGAHQEFALLFAEWLLDSDFAEVLGAGLGALYGLLPSKLRIDAYSIHADTHDSASSTSANSELGTTNERTRMQQLGLGHWQSAEVQGSMSTFLGLLRFTQSVLDTAEESARSDRERELVASMLEETVLASVRSIFLDSVVYPSMMECTEADGSALAVLTYLRTMLATLNTASSVAKEIFVCLGGDEKHAKARPHQSPAGSDILQLGAKQSTRLLQADAETKAIRRKSSAWLLVQAAAPATNDADQLTYFDALGRFSLRDLIQSHITPVSTNLHASDQATSTAAILLFDLILRRHHVHAASLLDIKQSSFPSGSSWAPTTTPDEEEFIYPSSEDVPMDEDGSSVGENLGSSLLRLRKLATLADCLSSGGSSIAGTAEAKDARLESEPKYLQMASWSIASDGAYKSFVATGQQPPSRHDLLIKMSSPLGSTLTALESFLANPPSLNLALSGLLTALAACPYRSLDAWLLPRSGFEDALNGSAFYFIARLVECVQHLQSSNPSMRSELRTRHQSLLLMDDLSSALDQDDLFNKSAASTSASTYGNGRMTVNSNSAANPFAQHFEQTKLQRIPLADLLVGSSQANITQTTSLSTVLDNIIILEEIIRELVAIIQIRRAVGIDALA